MIAAGEGKGPIAAFRYLLTGTIGASMYLLGVGFLYAATGTLNMTDLALRLSGRMDSPLVILAMGCMIVGFGIKMALFPFHGWQPAAHSYAHEGADPMIAGIMIKIPAYAMIRFFYGVFKGEGEAMEYFLLFLSVLAVCGVLYGSLKALRYDVYNKILAYSSIGQVGYIAMGIALGNDYGLAGALLHIVSHAFMKSGLFYTSGALKYKFGIHNTPAMGQVYRGYAGDRRDHNDLRAVDDRTAAVRGIFQQVVSRARGNSKRAVSLCSGLDPQQPAERDLLFPAARAFVYGP